MAEENQQQEEEKKPPEEKGLSPEELTTLKEKAATVDEFKEKESVWAQEKKDLEQAVNPNWSKARQTMEDMKTALKEKGIETDSEGNIVNKSQGVNMEEIKKVADQSAKAAMLGGTLETILEEYDTESKELVRDKYNSLTRDKDITINNVRDYINEAEAAARVGSGTEIKKTQSALNYSGGSGPRQPEEGKLDNTRLKEYADLMNLKLPGEDVK